MKVQFVLAAFLSKGILPKDHPSFNLHSTSTQDAKMKKGLSERSHLVPEG